MRQTMTNPASAFQPAIDALEKDLADLERQANGLLQRQLLREKSRSAPEAGRVATNTIAEWGAGIRRRGQRTASFG